MFSKGLNFLPIFEESGVFCPKTVAAAFKNMGIHL